MVIPPEKLKKKIVLKRTSRDFFHYKNIQFFRWVESFIFDVVWVRHKLVECLLFAHGTKYHILDFRRKGSWLCSNLKSLILSVMCFLNYFDFFPFLPWDSLYFTHNRTLFSPGEYRKYVPAEQRWKRDDISVRCLDKRSWIAWKIDCLVLLLKYVRINSLVQLNISFIIAVVV